MTAGELEYFSSPNDEKLKLIPVSNPDRGVIALFSLLPFFLYLDENVFGDLSVGDGRNEFSVGEGLKESITIIENIIYEIYKLKFSLNILHELVLSIN